MIIRRLETIGGDKAVVFPASILNLLNLGEQVSFELKVQNGGLFLRPVDLAEVYDRTSEKYRDSLDKLGE